MQTGPSFARNSARRSGLIYGAIFGLAQAIALALSRIAQLGGVGDTLINIVFVAWLLGFIYVGYHAATKTGKAGTGAAAGCWMGLVSAVICLTAAVLTNLDHLRQLHIGTAQLPQGLSIPDSVIIAVIICGLILAVLVSMGLGSALGALGGTFGRNRTAIVRQSA